MWVTSTLDGSEDYLVPNKGDETIKQYCGDIMALRWNDIAKAKSTKIVNMLSIIHTGQLTDSGNIFCNTNEPVYKPDVIVYYNKNVGGVDLLIKVMILCCSQQRSVK